MTEAWRNRLTTADVERYAATLHSGALQRIYEYAYDEYLAHLDFDTDSPEFQIAHEIKQIFSERAALYYGKEYN